jgi:hypothetical protein
VTSPLFFLRPGRELPRFELSVGAVAGWEKCGTGLQRKSGDAKEKWGRVFVFQVKATVNSRVNGFWFGKSPAVTDPTRLGSSFRMRGCPS